MVRELLGRTDVLGVCLGHQLIARAVGRPTYKLPFGHRGANHPVLEHRSRRVLVTSQNHGFAVAAGDEDGVTHTSLYDGTVEGLDVAGAARALGAVPSRGIAWAARRAAHARRVGGGPCRVEPISTRSA